MSRNSGKLGRFWGGEGFNSESYTREEESSIWNLNAESIPNFHPNGRGEGDGEMLIWSEPAKIIDCFDFVFDYRLSLLAHPRRVLSCFGIETTDKMLI